MAKRLGKQASGSTARWAMAAAAVFAAMSAGAQPAEMVRRSNVIFIGTIVRVRAVSLPEVTASANTAVVSVDSLLEKPAAVALSEGQEVTVLLKDTAGWKPGVQATFYTQGWILGKGVALKEIGHEMMRAGATTGPGTLRTRLAQERRRQLDEELGARIRSADVVVAGRVLSVRKAASAAGGRKPVTEHDPNWMEATVRVQTSMKGARSGDEIIVRFPGSEDVLYRDKPKYIPNQEGMFILKKDTVTGLHRAIVGTARVDAYVADRPVDVRPIADSSTVRRLMRRR